MTNPTPSTPELSALTRVERYEGDTWNTEFPRSILKELLNKQWVRMENNRVWLTDAGRHVWEKWND